MRGQWVNYDNFNLVDLIDEVKTRFEPSFEPTFRVDSFLHGAMIVGKGYEGTCKELREFLKDDDLKHSKEKDIFDINEISKISTREEFLNRVDGEDWCISKYGFDYNNDHCAVMMGGDCIECFKDAVKNIRFKGE